MTSTPDAYTVEQIDSLGITASHLLGDTVRSLRLMAADAQATAERLLATADAIEARRAALDAKVGATPGLDFRLGNAATNVTDTAFGALNTTNLVAHASQAVTAMDMAVEAVNSARLLSGRL